ncbi:hypothetical protein TruAng_000448 [Truncatella angustata]|nr:hypothetical protein TruAng_000448 [Truncatella angustata]
MPDIDPMLEKHDPVTEVDVEHDVVMQSYPSPTVEGQDSGPFYHTTPRQEHQPPTDLDTQHDDGGQLAEPTSPRQGGRGTISSAEELQLAAQLSQGLTHGMPMGDLNDDPNLQHVMTHGLAQHEQELQQHEEQMNHAHEQYHHDVQQQQHDSMPQQHDGLPPVNEHDHEHMQEQMQEQLQEQMQEQMHDHMPDHEQAMDHAQHEQHLQHEPHHQGQQQQQQDMQHQYLPDQHHQQPHLQPAAPMDAMASPFQMQDSNVPPRKRSKVSRACDECRRKKVKCDAPSETGEEPCSNCRRSNMRCLFSRIPQKRGPSKGYIKELADRIHSIEGKLASEGANAELNELLNGARRDSGDLFTPADASRKRPYSSISAGEYETPTSTGQFGSEPRQIQPYQTTPSDRYRPPYSINGLAPTPIAAKHDNDTPSRPAAVMDGMGLDLNHIDQVQEIDETAFAAYLTLVHPVFPVLAANKSRLEQQLAQCPSTLRDAFTTALNGTIESFPSFNVDGGFRQNLTDASRSLTEWKANASSMSNVARLVHLQTLILIAIASDHCGPASLTGESGSPNKSGVLGEAIGVAYSMRLHASQANADLSGDSDADENVAIRAWWTLVMLDRWNAISTASPVFIPNDSVVILPGLKDLLGENVYHLARLCNILGHFVPVALLPPQTMTLNSGAGLQISSFLNLSIELFREVLPPTITPSTHPILHLVYWQSRLLAYLFQTNAKTGDVMWPCKELVSLLVGNPQMLNPLNHHFFCLTTLALLELTKVDSEREAANVLLRELLETQVAPSNWDNAIRDRISESLRPSTAQATMEATASQSLQHLADLATATEMDTKPDKGDTSLRMSDSYEHVGFDPRELARTGYLNALVAPRLAVER